MQDLSSKLGGLSVTQMGKFLLHGKKNSWEEMDDACLILENSLKPISQALKHSSSFYTRNMKTM